MSEINRAIFGKTVVSGLDLNRVSDLITESLKSVDPYDRAVINDQRDILVTCIRGLGTKGAIELLGKIGMWMVLHDV